MILITAGAYVDDELASEFGRIPPCFLPIGNKPTLAFQVATLKAKFPAEKIFVSLPSDFSLNSSQVLLLDDLGVRPLFVPAGISLRASLLVAINMAGTFSESVRVLHGDTLITDLPSQLDVIAVSHTGTEYNWRFTSKTLEVWSGFFAFSDTPCFLKCLAAASDFPEAVTAYGNEIGLLNKFTEDWNDVGHLLTYFRTRKSVTTERSFNCLSISGGVVSKGGDDPGKLEREANWFQSLPMEMLPWTPAYYGETQLHGGYAYALEYLPLSPLNELFVHGRHRGGFWFSICEIFDNWFELCVDEFTQWSDDHSDSLIKNSKNRLIVEKTTERLNKLEESRLFLLDVPLEINGIAIPSVRSIADECIQQSLERPVVPGFLHGDLCFSNCLYDGRNARLRVLDPRGVSRGSAPFGDLFYDLAKLSHSIIGLYDFILAGNASATCAQETEWSLDIHIDSSQRDCSNSMGSYVFSSLGGYSASDLLPEVVLLFLSMLPLHSDDRNRQQALFANALRLYSMLQERKG